MDSILQDKMNTAMWIGKSLFERGKATGSSANMSFLHNDIIYITASNSCFGRLTLECFASVSQSGEVLGPQKPSKELTLHKLLYEKSAHIGAVLHTHSFYATLWSCFPHTCDNDILPDYTPYLKMKVGKIGLIPYAKPGSPQLFDAFAKRVRLNDGFLLRNHGPIVGGKDLLSAFYGLEELEESAKMAWFLRKEQKKDDMLI